jgi:hypothetical protein
MSLQIEAVTVTLSLSAIFIYLTGTDAELQK